MSAINDRIAWCIEDSGLTKTAFAEKIKVSQQYASKLAKNGIPSDRTISDICIQMDEDAEFIKVCEQINTSDDDLIKRIIKAYWYMDEKEKATIRKLIDGFMVK